MRWTTSISLVAAMLGPCASASAQDAATVFEQTYGAEMKRVAATADPKDDVELAAKLLAAAKQSTGRPEMLTVLCEKAYELGAKPPAGHAVAIEALGLLLDKVPETRSAWRPKLIALCLYEYSKNTGADHQAAGETLIDLYMDAADEKDDAGEFAAAAEQARKALAIAENIHSPMRDDVQARVQDLSRRERLVAQVGELKNRLKAEPEKRDVREQIVRILLVDLDQPAEAAKFVDASLADPSLRTMVPLAAAAPASLEEAVCLDLGAWYRGLEDKAAPASKADMYERAKGFYQTFLDKHADQDLSRTKAQAALEEISLLIAKLSASAEGWTDVLRLVDLSRHVVGGTWERQEQKLVVAGWKPSRATIPLIPDGSYKLLVQFTRKDGDGSVAVLLPVGRAWCTLMLGGKDRAPCALNLVSDKPWEESPSDAKLASLETGKEYILEIKVLIRSKKVSLSADLNGQKYLRWQGAESMLTAALPGDILGPRSLGVSATDDAVAFLSARLKTLSGTTTALQDDKPSPTPRPVGGGGVTFPRGRRGR